MAQTVSKTAWPHATLIAGPTASGKSSLALKHAADNDAIIINADSMQVYDVLRVLTARPSAEEEALAPHFLYGYVDPSADYSTGHWMADVASVLSQLEPDRHVVFVGGTGLYFRALLGGLSPMPPVDPAVRGRWRAQLMDEGAPGLHAILNNRDADAAKTLEVTDGQRIARALEVLETTGKSILWWQAQKGEALVDPERAERIVIDPDRDVLKERIHDRFDQMIEMGALDEVRKLLALEIDTSKPAMKAIGVQQLSDYLNGQRTLEEAIELSKISTRQYAKRQMTWFRNQLTNKWKRTELSGK